MKNGFVPSASAIGCLSETCGANRCESGGGLNSTVIRVFDKHLFADIKFCNKSTRFGTKTSQNPWCGAFLIRNSHLILWSTVLFGRNFQYDRDQLFFNTECGFEPSLHCFESPFLSFALSGGAAFSFQWFHFSFRGCSLPYVVRKYFNSVRNISSAVLLQSLQPSQCIITHV